MNAPDQPTRELLQFGVKYRGRFTENDHLAFTTPWPAVAPKVDCEEKPDCPSQEEKDREVPERKVGEGVSCTKGLLDTGFRQYKRTRVFALPSVESGDVLLLSARYLSGLLRQSFAVAITDVSGTGIASASTFADENLSLVAKASMDGPHFLLLFIDGCSAKGEERYEFQVVRRGQKSADAVLFFGSSDANEIGRAHV